MSIHSGGLISYQSSINRRLIESSDVSEQVVRGSVQSAVGDFHVGEVDVDGLRDGDTSGNRRVNTSVDKSDVFGCGECCGHWVGAPCGKSVLISH